MEKKIIENPWKSKKTKNMIFALLILGSIAVTIKSIFVSLQMDEEYAISLSYRLLRGDRLIIDIWDPHQTSAFLIEFLMWIYIKLFGTMDYVVIFVRAVGAIIQLIVAIYMYHTMKYVINQERSFLLAVVYYNLSPKTYIMPEFSNMMVWALTLMLIALTRLAVLQGRVGPYDAETGCYRKSSIAADHWNWKMTFTAMEVGFWICIMVLSYPSCLLMFPFVVIYLWIYDEYRYHSIGLMTLVCAIGGIAYMANLFQYMTPAVLIENLQSLMASNGAHGEGWGRKMQIYGKDLCRGIFFGIIFMAVAFVLYKLLQKRKHNSQTADTKSSNVLSGMFILIVTALLYQFIHWILMLWEYESSYPFTLYFFLFGFAFYCMRKMKAGDREMGTLWLGANIMMYIAILLLTNLTLFTSVKYLMPGVLMAFIILIIYARDHAPEVGRRYIRGCLMLWCFVAIFVKGWAYTDNDGLMKNITSVGNVMAYGPGKGIITEYMQGYMQESEYEEFQTLLQPGDNLLVMDSNTLCYLYQDVNIAGPSTICTPTFDENLLVYWERHPDKYPDVIAVQCWYGELREDADYDWMMNWIETEFDAAEVTDGKYYRYFINRK